MTRPDPVALWDTTAKDLLAVLRDLRPEDWDRPALPEWSVRDVVAHLAHMESEAAGMGPPPAATSRWSPPGTGRCRPR